jgi:hypothetical protein
MKSFCKKMSFLPLSALAIASLLSCGQSSSSSVSEFEQSFVAVTSSTWDAEVAFNNKKNYKLALNLEKDNTFNLVGTYSSEVKETGGGGFGPGGMTTSSSETSSSVVVVPGDPFTISGTWSLEKGYGYILNFSDTSKTVVHVDYNKIQGRHEFYYLCTPDAALGSKTIFMQAKDSAFRKNLASDYQTWDVRDSVYAFTGTATGNNNSLAYIYIYMHSDHSAVINAPSGSDRSVTLGGTWTEDKTAHILTFTLGGKDYTAQYSINAAHPAYRLAYDSYSLLVSLDSSVSLSSITNADFDGATKYQFTGSYTTTGPDGSTKNVSLNLTELGTAYMYTGTTLTKSGTYTFANDVYNVAFSDGTSIASTKNGSSYVFECSISVKSFFGTSTINFTLTYTPGA